MTMQERLPAPDGGAPGHDRLGEGGAGRAAFAGYLALGGFVAAFLAWGMIAPVGGAVIAQGQFVADSNLKKVQHQSGGVVGRLLVREGDHVEAGELLIRLDDTVLAANLKAIAVQIDELTARAARLEAEKNGGSEPDFPAALLARGGEAEIARLIAAERGLFAARTQARDGQRAALRERISQLSAEIEGIRRQRAARQREQGFLARELAGVRQLFAQNLVQITRLSQLEREAAAMEGQLGLMAAQIEQAERRIAEAEVNIVQIDGTLKAESSRELIEVRARLAELGEKRIAAADQLKRVEIRAPVAGIVHQLAIHTIGGVLAPAETAMQIIPKGDTLLLEARVQPGDFDQLSLGQEAIVKIHAFNQRTTPELSGRIARLAGDVVRDQQTGISFYPVRIALEREAVERLPAPGIVAGMQADVFVKTGARTPADYLLKPLTDQVAKAFRER